MRGWTVTAAVSVCVLSSGPGNHAVDALDNGLAMTPPLGWSTWQTCGDAGCSHDACTEDEIKSVAIAMQASGMQQLGYSRVNLDDCWVASGRNNSDGRLTWDTFRFPSGIPALVGWLHARNFSFGIYTSAGNATCTGKPGSRGHYGLDALTFAEWGVDYIKLDWCGDIKDQVTKGAQAHRDFAAAVNATGRPMYIEVVAGYLFLWDEVATVANSWRFCTDHKDAWASTSTQIGCRADQLNVTGSPGGWADMDYLHTGGAGCATGDHCPGQTDDEYRTEVAIWSLTQAPLIVDTDVRNMSAVMKQALLSPEIIAMHQSTATPPGKHLGYWATCAEPLACSIWGRAVVPDGSKQLVALLNTGQKSHKITLEFAKLGWPRTATATVTDLWTNTVVSAAVTGSFQADVPRHGTAYIILTRA